MMSNTRCKYGNDVSLAQRLPLVEANATGDAGESVVSNISCTCFLHACNFPMWFWIIRVIMYLWTSPFQDVKCQSDTRYMQVLPQRIRQKKYEQLVSWLEKRHHILLKLSLKYFNGGRCGPFFIFKGFEKKNQEMSCWFGINF